MLRNAWFVLESILFLAVLAVVSAVRQAGRLKVAFCRAFRGPDVCGQV